jgi:hypothetical protein
MREPSRRAMAAQPSQWLSSAMANTATAKPASASAIRSAVQFTA